MARRTERGQLLQEQWLDSNWRARLWLQVLEAVRERASELADEPCLENAAIDKRGGVVIIYLRGQDAIERLYSIHSSVLLIVWQAVQDVLGIQTPPVFTTVDDQAPTERKISVEKSVIEDRPLNGGAVFMADDEAREQGLQILRRLVKTLGIEEVRELTAQAIAEAEQRPKYPLPPPHTKIGFRQAGRKYGVSHQTIRHWRQRGFVKALDDGVDEYDVAMMANTPPLPGPRPKHSPHKPHTTHPLERSAEADLVTLKEASEATGVPYGTLGTWIHQGLLEIKARVKAPARGGGIALVSRDDVLRLRDERPGQGRAWPQKKQQAKRTSNIC